MSGLSSANDGKAFKVILDALNHAGKFGYNITAHLYKFEEYGIPQARHRYIMIGIRGDLGLTFKVPKLQAFRNPVPKLWPTFRPRQPIRNGPHKARPSRSALPSFPRHERLAG